MDLKKLSKADQLIGGGSIVLLIASFLGWFKIDLGGPLGSFSGSGWDVGFLWGRFPVLLGLIMLAHVVITNFAPQVKLPQLPVSWGQVHLGLGILAGGLVLLKFLIGEEGFSRSFGLYLAVLAGIVLAVGGFLKSKEVERPTGPPTAF